MKVADYVINQLAERGIKDVFVVYGAANGDLIDAFTRNEDIRYIAVMHEQGGGFAAEGWSKVKNKLGVAIATSGPGGMNFVTSIGNCFYDSIPCLFITGQINSNFMRPDESIRQIGFQETDIVNICKPITKYAKLVEKPEDIRYELERAVYEATSGRPGPVLLDIPINVQKQQIEPEELIGFDDDTILGYHHGVIRHQVRQYIEDLMNSERPCLMIGGGVRLSGAEEELLELGRELKIPMFPTWNALDVVCDDYEYFGGRIGTYGGKGRNFGIQNTDLLLAIGSRIPGRITGGNIHSFAREAKKYMVDVDEAGLQPKLQQVPFDVNIYSDAKVFIQMLIAELKGYKELPDFSKWVEKVMTWKEKYDPVTEDMFKPTKYVHPYAFTRILSEEMKSNDIFCGDCGGNIVVTNHSFETKTGQRYFTNNGNSPMGFSFAAGIGATIAADKDQDVVCVIGDGGFNMNIQELQTLINYNVPLKTIIMNNHIYGITKAFQETNFEGRAEACGPVGYNPPNFKDIVEAYKIPTMVVDDGTDYDIVRKQIREFLDHDGPIVMDLNCHEYHSYNPKIIGWETPIEDMYPYLDEDEFNSNMIIKPIEYTNGRFFPSFTLDEEWGDD
jgi:acetolactate synthase I/II/III large subunit